MAKILYGIHGTGHGHAMRGLTIARQLPEHEFCFIANDDARSILEKEFTVHPLVNLGTVFKNYQVDMQATIAKALPILWNREKYTKQVIKIIEDFKPDVCMTDLEYFVPKAAKRVGLTCLTLDHQHIITCCKHDLPLSMLWDYYIQGLTPKFLFKPTDYNLIVSFYAPPTDKRYKVRVVPPILRDLVLQARPRDDGHVVVYQSNSTHRALIDFLRSATHRTCYVFGYQKQEGREGNVVFKKKSEQNFLELLEGCSYVIQGGGHTLMSESLYLGKPVFTLPINAMVEQRFNALYIEKLGYGMQANMLKLHKNILQKFEENLPCFRRNISQQNFCGNNLIFGLVDEFIKTQKLDTYAAVAL